MENSLDLTKMIIRFTQGAEDLNNLVKGIPEKELDLSAGPGEWSIRQIIHHLADDGEVYSFIIKRAIATPGAKVNFAGFPGNEVWSEALKNESRPIHSDLELIMAHRCAIAEFVSFFPERVNQTITFIGDKGKEAKFSVWQMLQMLSDHMSEHLATIRKIKTIHNIRK